MPANSSYYSDYLNYFDDIVQSSHGYLATSLCTLAIVANVCNIVIFTRKGMVSSTNIILTALAAADMLVALTYFAIAYIYYIQNPLFQEKKFSFYQAYAALTFHLSIFLFHYVSTWLAVMLAVWRFIAIFSPFSAHRLLSINCTRFVVLAIYFIAICINIPHFLIDTVVKVERANVTVYDIGLSEMSQEYDNFLNRFNNWSLSVIMVILPCVLLVCFTIALIIILHRAKAHRQNLATNVENDTADRRINIMLLAILLLFLFSELPKGTSILLIEILGSDFENNVFNKLVTMFEQLCLINHTFNCVVYYTMISKYRETLKSILKFGNRGQANSAIELMDTS